MFLRERISRRRFIAMTAALAGAAAAGLGASSCEPPLPDPLVPERGRANGMPHLAWAWHFGVDGPPERMASILAQNNLGLILKTHNGCDWMSKWDNSEWAITCPGRVQILSNYFERHSFPQLLGRPGARPFEGSRHVLRCPECGRSQHLR
jgi:hypothetical protein